MLPSIKKNNIFDLISQTNSTLDQGCLSISPTYLTLNHKFITVYFLIKQSEFAKLGNIACFGNR